MDEVATASCRADPLDVLVADATERLKLIERQYVPVGFACSFSAEDVVLLDLIYRSDLSVRVVTLDTGRLPEETHRLIEIVRGRYQSSIRVMTPNAERLESLVTAHGPNAFYINQERRQDCCRVRKIEPLTRGLAGCQAWITGLRREQSVTREALEHQHWDDAYKLMKCNPLATWSESDVWNYVRTFDLPYNELYDRGYRSIGCAPCTRAVNPGEDARAGRWWWEATEKRECGLHLGSDGKLVRAASANSKEPGRDASP